MKHSFSKLDISLLCGLSNKLGKEHGAGLAALQSRAYHAQLAGEPEASDLLARLPQEQLEELKTWAAPQDCNVGGVLLRYADAKKEYKLALDEDLEPCEFEGEDYITRGIADALWEPIEVGGKRIVYVADHKRSRWTSSVDSLQLDAAGIAWAQICGADGYVAGLWILEKGGQWLWRREPVMIDDLFDQSFIALCERIRVAAKNEDVVTGPHCQDCFSRQYCPEYLLPAARLCAQISSGNKEPLAAFGGALHEDNAAKALELYLAMRDTTEQMKGHMEAYARAKGGIKAADGKVWRQVLAKNEGTKFDAKRFEEKHPDIWEQYQTQKVSVAFDADRLAKELPDLANEYITATPPKNMGFKWTKG